jgi:hypothetical protein
MPLNGGEHRIGGASVYRDAECSGGASCHGCGRNASEQQLN